MCVNQSDLILKASAEDQTVVLYSAVTRQLDVFGLSVDGLHLVRHDTDPGWEGQLGVIPRAVAVTVEKHITHPHIKLPTENRAHFKSVWTEISCSDVMWIDRSDVPETNNRRLGSAFLT